MNLNTTSVSFLPLSTHTKNILKSNGIQTVGDLLQQTPESLYRLRHVSYKTVSQLMRLIMQYKYALDPDTDMSEYRIWVIDAPNGGAMPERPELEQLLCVPETEEPDVCAPAEAEAPSDCPLYDDLHTRGEYRKAVLAVVHADDIAAEDLPLTVTQRNALLRNRLFHLSDFITCSERDLLRLRRFGRTTADAVTAQIKEYLNRNESRILAVYRSEADPASENCAEERGLPGALLDLRIDGEEVERSYAAVMKALAKKFCAEEIFYNGFKKQLARFPDEPLSEADAEFFRAFRKQGGKERCLRNARYVLWGRNERLRYYDIDARDHTELLAALRLDTYQDTEVSTAELFREHRALMEALDIRNKIELHDLLKKLVPEGSFHEIRFLRPPIITFGEPQKELPEADGEAAEE